MSIQMSESSGTNSPNNNQSSRTRKRAKVWEHFQQEVVMIDGVPKTQCKYCSLRLTATKKSGTSHLINHIAESCPAIDGDARINFLATIKKQTGEGFVFVPKRSRELMVRFFIHAEVPFKKIEDPYFLEWVESMQPTFKVVGRQTLRDDAFNLYERMREDLHAELHNLDLHVCLTSDMWTSIQNIGYMVVTAHYIDREFNIKKKIISFKELKYPHTGFAIEEAIMSCLTYWGIRSKLFTITLDNASNNNSACQELIKNHKNALMFEGQHLHVRCCAHILNILVQDGMKIIKPTIHKLRELLKHLDSSVSRMQDFNSMANSKNLPSKLSFSFDTPTRWNSTYKMIVEGLMYRSVLDSYANQHGEVAPTELEWQKVESICAFLKAFEEATLSVSADRKPTAHRFLPLVLQIRHALNDPDWQTSDILKVLAAAMLSKFVKYWDSGFNSALVIATMLDPRRKGDYLNFFYEKTSNSVTEIVEKVGSAEDWLKDYYEKYEGFVRRNDEHMLSHSHEGSNSVGSPVLGKRKLEEEFALYKSRRRTARQTKSEFAIYLEEDVEEDSESFDVLDWWKRHAQKFPVLSSMARDFLAIPLSTVSSESAFSCGGRILGDTRSSLTPEMLEALICAKDWLIKANDPLINIPGAEGIIVINDSSINVLCISIMK